MKIKSGGFQWTLSSNLPETEQTVVIVLMRIGHTRMIYLYLLQGELPLMLEVYTAAISIKRILATASSVLAKLKANYSINKLIVFF